VVRALATFAASHADQQAAITAESLAEAIAQRISAR
jgi:hypothetical protein